MKREINQLQLAKKYRIHPVNINYKGFSVISDNAGADAGHAIPLFLDGLYNPGFVTFDEQLLSDIKKNGLVLWLFNLKYDNFSWAIFDVNLDKKVAGDVCDYSVYAQKKIRTYIDTLKQSLGNL